MKFAVLRRIGAIALSLSFVFFQPAGATTLFDSITGITEQGYAYSVYYQGPHYASFTTGADASTLAELQFALSAYPSGPAYVNVALYSFDASYPGQPGAGQLVATLGTISGITNDDFHVYSLTGLSQSLAANSRYWIQLTAESDSFALWAYYGDPAGTGVSGEYWRNFTYDSDTTSFGNTELVDGEDSQPHVYEMRVFAEPVGATPLPAALPMFAGGVTVIGLLSARRKKRTAA